MKSLKNIKINTEVPIDFDWEEYLDINKDLPRNYTEEQCINHFLNFGLDEKRLYKTLPLPEDFIWKLYLDLNMDLPRNYTEKQCINHFLNYGIYEKRHYKEVQNLATLFFSYSHFIEVDIFNILLQHIKLRKKIQYLPDKITSSHNQINKIIENYSNSYLKKYSILNKPDVSMTDNNVDEFSLILDKDHINSFSDFKKIEYTDFINLINIYSSFIFILDLPESYNGGTKVFINNITYKYSQHNNFLFLRPNNNLYNIYISDIKIVELSVSQIINIINTYKSKIDKFFLNHTILFSQDLLKFIFSLEDVKKTIITHDHFLLTNDLPQNTMDHIYDYVEVEKYPVYNEYIYKSVDTIVSQNINNIYMIDSKYHHKLIISELPDFKLSDKKIVTTNKTINVLFIGSLHDLKGCELIKFLINDYYKDTNIKCFVMGELSYYKGKKAHKYKNIDDFNSLLIDYKPNLIIETSVWPETYSYTLTLSMITQLPILILKKPFNSVIEDRAKDYDNVFFYSSLKQLNTLVQSKKQNFFYTIKPIIYFNNFWDNYFNYQYNEFKVINDQFNDYHVLNLMYQKNVVFITSKINVSNVELSYSSSRSIYTSKERLNQTINTINGIKQNIPNAFIILFDNSDFNSKDFNFLNQSVDYFINPCNDTGFLNYYTNFCKFKCLGEIAQFVYAYYYFFKHVNFTKIKYFFKISGRYYINKNFNYNDYDNSQIIFKQNKKVTDRIYFYTSFYKLTKKFLPVFFNEIIDIYSNKHKYFDKDLEVIFSEKFHKHITLVDTLGITQNYACWNFTDMI
jgi:hypothetical protein